MRALPLLFAASCGSLVPGSVPPPDGGLTEVVVTVETRDGVRLEADVRAAPDRGAPAVLLLHMVPPRFDRSGWPADLRAALHARGWTVMALDRRGAGKSGGDPKDAYEGELGKWDVEAAMRSLDAAGAGPIVLLGASNRTTSMIDYTAWAAANGARMPAGLGYLSGGPYTENQTRVADLPRLPSAFFYPASEAAWSDAQKPHVAPGSTFHLYNPGDHGTKLFATADGAKVRDDVVDFVARVVTP